MFRLAGADCVGRTKKQLGGTVLGKRMSVPSTLFPVPLKGMDEYLLEAPQGELEDEAE